MPPFIKNSLSCSAHAIVILWKSALFISPVDIVIIKHLNSLTNKFMLNELYHCITVHNAYCEISIFILICTYFIKYIVFTVSFTVSCFLQRRSGIFLPNKYEQIGWSGRGHNWYQWVYFFSTAISQVLTKFLWSWFTGTVSVTRV